MGNIVRFGRKTGAGEDGAAEPWMFVGLKGLAVVVEDVDPAAVEVGVNRTEVQLRVEEQLKQHGVPVVSLSDVAEDSDSAVLYVAIGADRHEGGPIALLLSLQVCEAACLARNPEAVGGVTTWIVNGIWASTPTSLATDVTDAIDEGVARLGAEYAAVATV